jgi:hypothetical protein
MCNHKNVYGLSHFSLFMLHAHAVRGILSSGITIPVALNMADKMKLVD